MSRPGKINIYLLAFTVYFAIATLGIPLYKHYCEGDLKKIQLFFQPEDCHVEEMHSKVVSHCCSDDCNSEKEENDKLIVEEGNCCTNKIEYYKVDVLSTKFENKQTKISNFDYQVTHFLMVKDLYSLTNIYPEKKLWNLKIPLKSLNHVKLFTLHQQFIC